MTRCTSRRPVCLCTPSIRIALGTYWPLVSANERRSQYGGTQSLLAHILVLSEEGGGRGAPANWISTDPPAPQPWRNATLLNGLVCTARLIFAARTLLLRTSYTRHVAVEVVLIMRKDVDTVKYDVEPGGGMVCWRSVTCR